MEGGGGEGPSAMAESGKNEEDDEAVDQLPPGFRFHPTDEEIIMHYLILKVMDKRFSAIAIAEADFNKCEPWDLPKKAKTGEKEWFFFWQRDRKYPTGMRTNRATETGYWKATGKDREIYKGSRKCVVGMKKTLVFYKGRAPKGEKSSWVMHEYRLEGNFSTYTFTRAAKDSWVVCKVFDKSNGIRRDPGVELARVDTFTDHLLDIPTLPLQSQVQHDQNKFFVSHNNSYQPGPRVNDPNPIFFPQNTPHPGGFFPYRGFGSQYQPGIDPMLNYSTSFPFKGGDQASLRLMQERTCKIENFSWNSMVSHSQDTGMSNEMANEITSTDPEVEDDQSKKPYDQELEGLAFSPNMSDLDSLWSY